jgi:hypothetical protein
MSASLDKSQLSAPPASPDLPKPYVNADGTLVIPMNSDPKYHWWKPGGQKLAKTVEELRAQAGSAG